MFWRQLPPAELQLAHIASALGIKSTSPAPRRPDSSLSVSTSPARAQQRDEQIALDIAQSGLPVFEGALPAELAALLADLPLT